MGTSMPTCFKSLREVSLLLFLFIASASRQVSRQLCTQGNAFEMGVPFLWCSNDDIGDYSTNEPTMDGTADAILMLTLLSNTP